MNFGNHYARPLWGKLVESSKGNPMLDIRLLVTHDGNSKPIDVQFEVTASLALSDKALGMSEARLRGLGFNGDYGDPKFTAQGTWVEYKEGEPPYGAKWELPMPPRKEAGNDAIQRLNALWRNNQGSTPPPPPGSVPTASPVTL